jgi:hypothetical protein
MHAFLSDIRDALRDPVKDIENTDFSDGFSPYS